MSEVYLSDKPIIASSTPEGNAALGVIRLSTKENPEFILKFTNLKELPKSRYAKFCQIKDGDLILDEVILTYFKAPYSYTGEYLFEISAHGNSLNLKKIIRLIVKNSEARIARAGEFTLRAYQNGKVSLSQIEGLDLFLNAKSELSLLSGISGLRGELQEKFLLLRESFIKLKAAVELSIDFLEDIGEERANQNFNERLSGLESLINELYQKTRSDLGPLLNPSIVMVGKTNAGKSTLFNELLQTKRSIVSSEEGTTRDYVSEYIESGGHQFRLIDTAGIRETKNSIEEEGINKALSLIKSAFYRLFIVNPLQGEPNWSWINDHDFDGVLFTHGDEDSAKKRMEEFDLSNKFDFFIKSGPIEPLSLGPIGPLSKKINDYNYLTYFLAEKYKKSIENMPVLVERQRNIINSLYLNFINFKNTTQNLDDIAIISSEINILGKDIDELIGVVAPDEVLGDIFSNFCIGK